VTVSSLALTLGSGRGQAIKRHFEAVQQHQVKVYRKHYDEDKRSTGTCRGFQ
jgi:hypothetical protein